MQSHGGGEGGEGTGSPLSPVTDGCRSRGNANQNDESGSCHKGVGPWCSTETVEQEGNSVKSLKGALINQEVFII